MGFAGSRVSQHLGLKYLRIPTDALEFGCRVSSRKRRSRRTSCGRICRSGAKASAGRRSSNGPAAVPDDGAARRNSTPMGLDKIEHLRCVKRDTFHRSPLVSDRARGRALGRILVLAASCLAAVRRLAPQRNCRHGPVPDGVAARVVGHVGGRTSSVGCVAARLRSTSACCRWWRGVAPLLRGDLAVGLLVAAAAPCTLASAAVWTRRAGGNDAVALMVTIGTNLTCFVVTPLWLLVTTGRAGIEFPLLGHGDQTRAAGRPAHGGRPTDSPVSAGGHLDDSTEDETGHPGPSAVF